MKKIGLVGGISWVSTIDYYRCINEGVNEKLGRLHFAECVIYSLNFQDLQDLSWQKSYPLLLGACKSLKKSGVEAIVLCANTAHLFADELEVAIGLPLIHIGKATAEVVSATGIQKIGLLGTKFTMELDFYKQKLLEKGLEVIVPAEESTRDFIQHTLKEELGRGILNPKTKTQYLDIIAELVANGAEGVILGCTEIPLLLNQSDVEIPVFDTTKIHSQAIVNFILS